VLQRKIPASLCDTPLHDRRIHFNINFTAYLANYPWIQKVFLNARACCCGRLQDACKEIVICRHSSLPLWLSDWALMLTKQ